MILRANQVESRDKAIMAVNRKGNTLLVAPTGFGKTITMATIAEEMIKGHGARKVLTLQHREELVSQNSKKFKKFTKNKYSISLYDADSKSFRGRAIFAMVQTLSGNLDDIPDNVDVVLIDEAHRSPANSFLVIIAQLKRKNPNIKIIGVTATPVRGDKKKLTCIFDNVCHVVSIGEMIANGYLVPPVTYKPQVENIRDQTNAIRKSADGEFDQEKVAEVLNKKVVNEAVIYHWKRLAGDRKTVVFCANVEHAIDFTEALQAHGIMAQCVHSKMPKGRRENPAPGTRRRVFKDYENGKFQVLINVMVATEGWDDQPTSCVVILRACAHRSTFTQIVGRGLRKVDQLIYPGMIKIDCIVLDFCSKHDSLEQDIQEAFIQEIQRKKTELPPKICPNCIAEIPARSRECYICGHEFPYEVREKEEIENVDMVQIDILSSSKMAWIDLFDNGRSMMASGFKAWAAALMIDEEKDLWCCVASKKDDNGISEIPKMIDVGGRVQCLASAHDWMNCHETNKKAGKNSNWGSMPATQGQLKYLGRFNKWDASKGMSSYAASCRIEYAKQERNIINATAQIH